MFLDHTIKLSVIEIMLHGDSFTLYSHPHESSGKRDMIPGGKIAPGQILILIISGDNVSSKTYKADDPIARKILHNTGLYTTLHENDIGCSHIDFIRKDLLADALKTIESSRCIIIDTIVSRHGTDDSTKNMIRDISAKMSLKGIWHNQPILDFLAGKAFRKSLMPVLIIFLVVLAINFFIRQTIADKTTRIREDYAAWSRRAEEENSISDKQSTLVQEYLKYGNTDIPAVADLAASLIPEGTRLTAMYITGQEQSDVSPAAVVKGESANAESITLLLKNFQQQWARTDVVSIGQDRSGTILNFEIHIWL